MSQQVQPVEHPAVETAKDVRAMGAVIERYGVRGHFVPVPLGLLQDALTRLRAPTVPVVYLEEKGREEENPLDPGYLGQVEGYQREVARVSTELLTLFGVELDDPVPGMELGKDAPWVRRLRLMERRGALDLSGLDLDDPVDLEFAYKRYVWCIASDIQEIAQVTGVSSEALSQAGEMFRRP